LGFTFPKNFNHPYVSLSIGDFWRRWHMTLSRWLRDYLYISLGGNRHGSWLTMRNLFLTMFLGGIWHGASWNFALWGVLHGVYLAFERLIDKFNWLKWNLNYKIIRLIKWFIIFNLVCLAWIFFRSPNISHAVIIINNIIDINENFSIKNRQIMPYILIISMPLIHFFSSKIKLISRSELMESKEYIFWHTLLLLLLIFLTPDKTGSFMYFQF